MSSRRHRYKYGWERALSHITAASAFSAEVDGTDRLVKDVFFRLVGAELDSLYAEYGRRYGSKAASYAREAREKWRRGDVKMSGIVSQRLYTVIPPFMSLAEKQQVVQVLWRRYFRRSHRYLYLGPDASVNNVMTAVQQNFDSLLSLGNLPLTLTSRFEWLMDNDAVATRRLLARFVDEQMSAALTAGRANVTTMLAAMREKAGRDVESLSHTITVGNQNLTLKADPLRTGIRLSDSPFDRMKPAPRFKIGGLVGLAAVLAVLFVVARGGTALRSYGSGAGGGYSAHGGYGGGGYGSTGGSGGGDAAGRKAAGSGISNAGQGGLPSTNESVDASEADRTAVAGRIVAEASPAQTYRSPGSMEAATESLVPLATVTPLSPKSGSVTRPKLKAVTAASSLPRPSTLAQRFATPSTDGCTPRRVARVSSDGFAVDIDDGEHIIVSAVTLMRIAASQWSTGDDVVVCAATDSAGNTAVSIEAPTHYARIQGMLAYTSHRQPVSCSRTALRSMDDDGRLLQTMDGSSFEVSASDLMRIAAGQWSTADVVLVCTARMHDDSIAAGITNPSHYSSVQAIRMGKVPAGTISCWPSRVVVVSAGGQEVQLSGGATYVISSAGLMRIAVSQWTTGEAVQVCSSQDRSGVVASIENPGRYAKIQARRSTLGTR